MMEKKSPSFLHVYSLSLRFLGFRPRSTYEVTAYLTKKNIETALVEQVIQQLEKENFLNDETFIYWWIGQRTRSQLKSKYLIIKELQAKGIKKDKAIEVFEKYSQDIPSDMDMAKKILAKKKEKYQLLSSFERLQKLGPFLARRGFSIDIIRRSIDEIFEK